MSADKGGVWSALIDSLPRHNIDLADYLPPNKPSDGVLPVQKQQVFPAYVSGAHYTVGTRVGVASGASAGVWICIQEIPISTVAAPASGSAYWALDTADFKRPVNPAIVYRPSRYPVIRDTEIGDSHLNPSFPSSAVFPMVISDVIVRRAPVKSENGIYLVPTAKPALSVSIGCILIS